MTSDNGGLEMRLRSIHRRQFLATGLAAVGGAAMALLEQASMAPVKAS
jgi:hypothetical protein